MGKINLDEVGLRTDINLWLLRDYLAAYSAILSKHTAIRQAEHSREYHCSRLTGGS